MEEERKKRRHAPEDEDERMLIEAGGQVVPQDPEEQDEDVEGQQQQHQQRATSGGAGTATAPPPRPAPGSTPAAGFSVGMVVRERVRSVLTHRLAGDFVLGGLATVTAVLFTNPIEVVKTRLQLQGELQQRVAKDKRTYKGVWHAFRTIITTEGPLAIQKGLFPAAAYQFCMNGMRLGSYSVLKQLLHLDHSAAGKDSTFLLKNMLAGATAGVLGAVAGSPFFLVKTRMQAQTDVPALAVGHQYKYKNSFQAFKSIIQTEGIRGVMRGADAAALRVGVGSSVQLPLYDNAKSLILSTGLLGNNIYAHVAASLVSGVGLVLAMNPFDVVSTRMYNQRVEGGKGVLYSGPIDCLWKTVKAEGVYGLYKGVFAHYLRTGPHTILTFVFWEQYKKLAKNL